MLRQAAVCRHPWFPRRREEVGGGGGVVADWARRVAGIKQEVRPRVLVSFAHCIVRVWGLEVRLCG